MKKQSLLLSSLVFFTLSLSAQKLPPTGYISWYNEGKSFFEELPSWSKGQALSEDDNFFISRVKPKVRFRNVATQVNQTITEESDKKLMYWVPINNPGNNALPDGIFDSEVFPMWSYITHYGNWSTGFVRMPGNFADVAHKNGVGVSVVGGIPYGELSKEWEANFKTLLDAGSDKMADMLQYYGIDGLGYNSEFRTKDSELVPNLITYHKELYTKMHASGNNPLYEMIWYDGTNDNGGIQFDNGLGDHNDGIFGTGENPVTTSMFFNYNWNHSTLLGSSVTKAKSLGRNSLDLYAGFNMQGAEPKTGSRWPLLAQYPISIGLWGAHTQNMFFESRGEKGAMPDVQQRTYMLRVERWFTGGTRNPINTPELSNSMTYNADNTDFFGMSKLMSARSSLSWDLNNEPFITYFNLGNGKFFNWNGERKLDREWYNIGVQDYLPTWRWWFANEFMGRTADKVPAKGLDAEFVWDDAYMGGSLMRVYGSTTNEYLHLFKTQFLLKTGDVITVRYKVIEGSADVSLALSAVGTENTTLAENSLKLVETSSVQTDVWVEKEFTVRGALLSLNNKTLAMIALHFANAEKMNMYLGELSIVRGTFEKPAAPIIDKTVVLAANHKGIDGKILFSMENNKPAGETCYNLDVKTSMFKLYAQQEGKEPILVGVTTSWAGMYYALPFDFTINDPKVRFGASAVALDMKSESDIAWGDYMAIDSYYIIRDEISINKTMIKPGEDFAISFIDRRHEPSTFELLNDKGVVVKKVDNVIELSLAEGEGLEEIGTYSFRLTGKVANIEGTRVDSVRTFGSYVQVTDKGVGALPKILSLTANDKEADITTSIATPIVMKYTGRQADGVCSNGIDLEEKGFGFKAGDMEMKEYKSFSLAYWVRINQFVSSDPTQLVNIRDKNEGWPKTDWGWLWSTLESNGMINVTFRGTDLSENNELKYHFANTKIELGPWTHMAWVFDINDLNQIKFSLYINGVEQEVTSWERTTGEGGTGAPDYQGDVYAMRAANMVAFGGNSAGCSGVDGTLDNYQYWDKVLTAEEVKASMNNIDEIPEHLLGFWDIETKVSEEGTFASIGTKAVPAGVHTYVAAEGEGKGTLVWSHDVVYAPGCPFLIGGTSKVETKPIWAVGKAGSVSESTGNDQEGSASIAFAKDGVYTATLTLQNGWGKDSKSFQYITVGDGSGIESVDLETELSAYPNPFIDNVNVRFANEGDYIVRIYDINGMLIAEKQQTVTAGEFMQINVNANSGSYIAQILNNGKLVRAVKLIKK